MLKSQSIHNDPDFENLLQARTLFKKGGQEVPVELLNNIGVLQFERADFQVCFSWKSEFCYDPSTKIHLIPVLLQLAQQTFEEALGDGIWLSFIIDEKKSFSDAAASILQFKDMQLFHDLECNGHQVEIPWDKVTVLFNLARLLEQLNKSGTASVLYRLILFKVYVYSLEQQFVCQYAYISIWFIKNRLQT